MTRTVRDSLVANNEPGKLVAGFSNPIGVGLIGFGVLRPLTEDLANANASMTWWTRVGLAVHGLSHYILNLIRKEARE